MRPQKMTISDFSTKHKNDIVIDILKTIPGGKFLEIGLGMTAHKGRHEAIRDLGIHYTGMYFDDVCARHLQQLRDWQLDENCRTIGNHRDGSYLFNLVDLLRSGERFDFIYFDGHHTLNVDAAPMLVCGLLIEENGLLSLDDYNWSLSSQEINLKSMGHYDGVYNFLEYSAAQRSAPHVRIIAESLLHPLLNLSAVNSLSTTEWRTFRVGGSSSNTNKSK